MKTTQDYIADQLAAYGGCDQDELIQQIATTALDYHRAREARLPDRAQQHLERYEELTARLGFDPLA